MDYFDQSYFLAIFTTTYFSNTNDSTTPVILEPEIPIATDDVAYFSNKSSVAVSIQYVNGLMVNFLPGQSGYLIMRHLDPAQFNSILGIFIAQRRIK